jgi:hypothetical protein
MSRAAAASLRSLTKSFGKLSVINCISSSSKPIERRLPVLLALPLAEGVTGDSLERSPRSRRLVFIVISDIPFVPVLSVRVVPG